MERITISDIANSLVARHGLKKKEAELFVVAAFEIIQKRLEIESSVKVKGLGTFKIIGVGARESVNVNTGERVVIESHGKITFTPDNVIKELVNKPFSQFETVVLNDGVKFADIDEDGSDDKEMVESDTASGDLPDNLNEVEEVDNAVQSEEGDCAIVRIEEDVEEESSEENNDDAAVENCTPDLQCEEYDVAEVTEKNSDEVAESAAEIMDSDEVTPVDSRENDNPMEIPEPEDEPEDEVEVGDGHIPENGADLDKCAAVVHNEVSDNTENGELKKGSSGFWKWAFACFVVLVLMAVSAVGGYLYGVYETSLPLAMTKKAIERQTDVARQKKVVHRIDTVAVKKTVENKDTANQVFVESAPKEQPKKIVEVKPDKNAILTHEQYSKMDKRVKFGAYRIVGLDKEVKVKKGETLLKISNRHLGPGMVCYIEVFNGLTSESEIREGQTVRIPKLKLKKQAK